MSEEAAADINPPEAKKPKMSIEQSPDEEWPEGEHEQESFAVRSRLVTESKRTVEISSNE
jgi:hypothetical protein